MIAIDTSVAVAAFGDWHRQHDVARALVDDDVALPSHVLLETFAVLTGFPPPHRAAPGLVREWLDDRFPRLLPPPPPDDQRAIVATLAVAGRSGGAVYDALVGLTAKLAGATLVTADLRATALYELIGVEVRPLAASDR